MSFFSDLIDFGSSFFDTPNKDANTPVADPNKSPPMKSGLDFNIGDETYNVGKILKKVIPLAAPFIVSEVLKTPEVKYAPVPDSVKNDPRIQKLIGDYGGYDNAPTAKGPSTFQLAFPSLLQNLFAEGSATEEKTTEKVLDSLINKGAVPPGVDDATNPTYQQRKSNALQNYGEDRNALNQVRSTERNIVKYEGVINNAASKYGVAPEVLKAVITAESGGNPRAVSETGVKGISQVTMNTASSLAGRPVSDAERANPVNSINFSAQLLRQLYTKYKGDEDKIFRAYNAGEGAVSSGAAYKPGQANTYSARVNRYLKIYRNKRA